MLKLAFVTVFTKGSTATLAPDEAGVMTTVGADAYATLNVSWTCGPEVDAVPVSKVMVPAVSLPTTLALAPTPA